MTPLKRFPAAVAFLGLLALPVASQGKPSPKVPPTTKNTPTVEDAPVVKKTPKLAAKHIKIVKKKKPMTVEAKREVLAASGMQADAADLGEPMTVSARNPITTKASLSFVGLNMVLPNQSVAVIGQVSDMNDFDGFPHPESTEAVTADGCEFDIGGFCSALRQATEALGTVPKVGGGYVTLRFRAAPETGYVVDCIASGDGGLAAFVYVGKTVIDTEEGPADGRFEYYLPRGPRRDVRIDLGGEQPWTLRQCQLTPVRG